MKSSQSDSAPLSWSVCGCFLFFFSTPCFHFSYSIVHVVKFFIGDGFLSGVVEQSCSIMSPACIFIYSQCDVFSLGPLCPPPPDFPPLSSVISKRKTSGMLSLLPFPPSFLPSFLPLAVILVYSLSEIALIFLPRSKQMLTCCADVGMRYGGDGAHATTSARCFDAVQY